MTDTLFEHKGTLDKYIGDAIVGFWGAPTDMADHAYQGVKSALQMIEALPEINQQFQTLGFPEINIGIGLNTGEVSVGNMGSDLFFQYTALGDHMNLASRIESLTKQYEVNLLISEFTREKLGTKQSEFMLRPIDNVQVKGREAPVLIYEVLPSFSAWNKNLEALIRYTAIFYTLFMKQEYGEAKKEFLALGKSIEDRHLQRLIQTCDGAQKNEAKIHFTKLDQK